MAEPTDAADFATQIRALPLPIGLIDLQSGKLVAVSDKALEFGPLPADEILGQSVLDHIHPEERAGVAAALEAMATGSIDLFRVWPLALAEEPSPPAISWVRRFDIGESRFALYELADASLAGGSPLGVHLGHEPIQMAVGSLDDSGKVVLVSTSISKILGIEASALVGRELIGDTRRSEVARVLDASSDVGRDRVVGARIRLRNGAGDWQPLHLILASLRGLRDQRLFILTPDLDEREHRTARIADLEHHLWKIAAELDAAGVLTRMGAVAETRLLPEHGTLTTRQWEVLGRLVQGERVPTIAEELFLSQSTVRGHVATILKRFGVRSQPELLKLLRGRTAST